MPESLVLASFYREMENPPDKVNSRAKTGTRSLSAGKFIVHKECCAQVDGNRQTFSLHQPPPSDPLFVPFLSSSDESKLDCLPPSVDIVRDLGVQGELIPALRGKELLFGIQKYIFRVCYSLEGHSFWIPTATYDAIVMLPPVNRGKKSKTYNIPPELWDGVPSVQGQVSIQAAFRCPDWTLLFVDHNVMLTFHVMALREPCTPQDLIPGSALWKHIWSRTHGPSLVAEVDLASSALEVWRQDSRSKNDRTPIFCAVKSTQTVFNGYGAQETNDMLVDALIHPSMPTFAVCSDDKVWARFKAAVFSYQKERVKIAMALPYVSGLRPFRFNKDSHGRFLVHVSSYRRSHVKVNHEALTKIKALGLLNPSAIIQNNGIAMVSNDPTSASAVNIRSGCKRVKLPNFIVAIPAGSKTINMYTPFTARPHASWQTKMHISTVSIDVGEEYNSTTLGPFSFQVFVLAAWTDKKFQGKSKLQACENRRLLEGRRSVEVVGKGTRKRPRSEEIVKTSQEMRKAKRVKKENLQVSLAETDTTSHRSLRARVVAKK